jgi:signal transduction histidine kinase
MLCAVAYRCAVDEEHPADQPTPDWHAARMSRRVRQAEARAHVRAQWRAQWRARTLDLDVAPWNRPGELAGDGPPRRVRSGLFMAILVGLVQVIGTRIAAHGVPLPEVAYLLLIVGPAALIFRRAQPLPAYALALAATVLYLALDLPRGPYVVAGVVALAGATQRSRREWIWAITGAGYLAYVAMTVLYGSIAGVRVVQPSPSGYLIIAIIASVAVLLAVANRIRSERFREMARAAAEAARARREQTRRQASDERLRIARELHDVLGHHLSLINVRAGVALHLLESRPEEVRGALDAIKLASAEALREVRGVLATLDPDGHAPRAPAHGLSDVDSLVAETVAAGLPVQVVRDGAARPVPAEVDRAAYRIVQEALTNVRRHAGAEATATVVVGYGPHLLSLLIEDTGQGSSPSSTSSTSSTSDGSGNGIPGMRERAAALGGTLVAADTAHGFRVEATLPIPEEHT